MIAETEEMTKIEITNEPAAPVDVGLASKLREISALEDTYSLIGVSFSVDTDHSVLTRECASDVIEMIKSGVALMNNHTSIPSIDQLLKEHGEAT